MEQLYWHLVGGLSVLGSLVAAFYCGRGYQDRKQNPRSPVVWEASGLKYIVLNISKDKVGLQNLSNNKRFVETWTCFKDNYRPTDEKITLKPS